jgi:xanthine dehydrogenase accessory factor
MATNRVDCIGLVDVAKAALDAQNGGRAAVAGRVVDIQGFSTWAGDELIVVDNAGTQHGWLLGDYGARRVRDVARAMFDRADAALTTIDIEVAGAAVAETGLSCGGRAELLLQPTAGIPSELWARLAERAPVGLLTCIDGPGQAPASMVVDGDGLTVGSIVGETASAVAEAVALLAGGHSATRRVTTDAGTVLVEVWVPTPRLVVVGTGDVLDAVSAQAGLLGWDVRGVGDRSEPDGADPGGADAWPALHDGLVWAGASAALIVLSHDPHVDVPAIGAALERAVPYIGAMGSRQTQSRRLARLAAAGHSERQLDSIHRPIGLDLGGRSSPEVALAICAEILAVHCGRDARPLRDANGPITDRPVASL